jgi:TetR/AcrR family transcriptional regulator, tetracycline repressor protein
MRAVAARLDVQVGGLYYYLPDKGALLRLMADRLCEQITHTLHPVGDWRADTFNLCITVRTTLLQRHDAARVFAQSPLSGSAGALGLMERLLELLGHGVPAHQVHVAGDTIFSYITGYVLQEQLTPSSSPVDPQALDQIRARFPLVFAPRARDPDATFRTAIEAILAGFETTSLTTTRPRTNRASVRGGRNATNRNKASA